VLLHEGAIVGAQLREFDGRSGIGNRDGARIAQNVSHVPTGRSGTVPRIPHLRPVLPSRRSLRLSVRRTGSLAACSLPLRVKRLRPHGTEARCRPAETCPPGQVGAPISQHRVCCATRVHLWKKSHAFGARASSDRDRFAMALRAMARDSPRSWLRGACPREAWRSAVRGGQERLEVGGGGEVSDRRWSEDGAECGRDGLEQGDATGRFARHRGCGRDA
jgi:hypothetical protein